MKNRKKSVLFRLTNSKKAIILTICAAVVVLATVGITLSTIFDIDGPIRNYFRKSYVKCQVEETLAGGVKKDVKIKNTGDTQAYTRAAVIVTWKDASGNVNSSVPVPGTDYNINYNLTANGWRKASDGYYYFRSPVDPGDTTDTLISSCSPVSGRAPAGYSLSVEILGSAIQSKPSDLVIGYWSTGVSGVTGTMLKIK